MRRIRNLLKSYNDLSGERAVIVDTIHRIKQQIGFMKDEFSYRLDKLFSVFLRYCQANCFLNPKKGASSIQNPSMSLMRPRFSSQSIPTTNIYEQMAGKNNQSDMYSYLIRMMNMLNANKDDPNLQTYNINCRFI